MTSATVSQLEAIKTMERERKVARLRLYALTASKRYDWGPEHDRPLIIEAARSAIVRLNAHSHDAPVDMWLDQCRQKGQVM